MGARTAKVVGAPNFYIRNVMSDKGMDGAGVAGGCQADNTIGRTRYTGCPKIDGPSIFVQ